MARVIFSVDKIIGPAGITNCRIHRMASRTIFITGKTIIFVFNEVES